MEVFGRRAEASQTGRSSGGAPHVLLPVVWALALGWLAVQSAGRWLGLFLEAYERSASAAGRAVLRAGRAVLRALGPVGRLLRRVLAPPLRLLRRAWDWLNVQVLLRMFRPLRRWAGWLVEHLRPVVAQVLRWVLRQLARLDPVLRGLAAGVEHVERAAARLGQLLGRAWAPVARVARQLRPGTAARDRPTSMMG